jgi:hypothetical protein
MTPHEWAAVAPKEPTISLHRVSLLDDFNSITEEV